MVAGVAPCCKDCCGVPKAECDVGECLLTSVLGPADTSSDTQLKTAAINQDALEEQAASMATPATA